MSMPESKPAVARSQLEIGLGFRIEPRPDGEAGTVVWIGKTAVRPATGVELALWKAVNAIIGHEGLPDYVIRTAMGIPAERSADPFGTPKEEE